jgi:hypothetical protein
MMTTTVALDISPQSCQLIENQILSNRGLNLVLNIERHDFKSSTETCPTKCSPDMANENKLLLNAVGSGTPIFWSHPNNAKRYESTARTALKSSFPLL